MAYDEDLANRVRAQLAGEQAVTEKAMFGGLAFMLSGNMAVGLTGDELMVRLAPDDGDAALAEPDTRPFDMTGRPMRGWILVGDVAGEMNLGSKRVGVPRFSPDNPALDATGRIDAMALYAGQGVGSVRRRELAAAIVADLVSRLPRGNVERGV